MPHANTDELRFFLNDREELTPQVQAIGATVTELLAAVSAEDCARHAQLSARAQAVSALLEDAKVDAAVAAAAEERAADE